MTRRARRAGRARPGGPAAGLEHVLPAGPRAADVKVVGRDYDPAAEDTSGWAPEHWGAGGARGLDGVEHLNRYQRLIATIDERLHYPSVLGERQMDGVINVRLGFAPGSRCVWPPRLDGAHPYLRVYALALLRDVCGLEALTALGFEPGQGVDLSFAFVLSDAAESNPRASRLVGNVLTFERIYPRRAGGYRIGPIRGVWFAPVVALDWPWVVEHWETWVGGQDPLRDFR